MPGQTSTARSQAQVCLNFIIVGGSIAGLATGYVLKRAGHNVLIIERGDGKAKSQGGLRSPPNMTKILQQWGLGPTLDHMAHKCNTFKLHNGKSGESIGSMIMTESFLAHFLADFLFLQHGDLHSMMYDLACQEGVKFMFNTIVTGADSETLSVILKSGAVLKADVIVGADGYDSIIRPVVTGQVDEDLHEKNLLITYIVPVNIMQEDDDLRTLINPTVWSLWLGDGYIFHANLLAGGRDFTVTIVYRYDLPLREGDEAWHGQCPLERFQLDYGKFEPRTLKLLKLAKNVSSRIFLTRPHLESLVCERARIVLVGEAAHPLLPGGHHTTALAVEDAQTLGILFSRLKDAGQTPQLLSAYEEIRQPRVSSTQMYEVQHQAMLSCPAGPAMTERDMMMRTALAYGDWEHMDEATFKMVWGNELTLTGHDASEKVDDWWTHWGGYFDRNVTPRAVNQPADLQISISKADYNECAG